MWRCASAGIWPGGRRGLQRAQIEAARRFRHAAVKQDQAEQQNETAGREIDRDLPRGGEAIAAPPDSDEEKSRDERQLVEGVEEKQIERSERAQRARRDEEQAGVERVLMLRRFCR